MSGETNLSTEVQESGEADSQAADSAAPSNSSEGLESTPESSETQDKEDSRRPSHAIAAKHRHPTPIIRGSGPEPEFESYQQALVDLLYQTNKKQKVNEDLILTSVFKKNVRTPYFELWQLDINKQFALQCRLKRRKRNAPTPSPSNDEHASSSKPSDSTEDEAA